MAIHRKHLKDNGIKILSAMENIPDTPEGILLESLLEGFMHLFFIIFISIVIGYFPLSFNITIFSFLF